MLWFWCPPSVEVQLNDRQKQIIIHVQQEGKVTSGWCLVAFGISYNTAYRDLSDLVVRGPLIQRGKGRANRYEINTDEKNLSTELSNPSIAEPIMKLGRGARWQVREKERNRSSPRR